MRTPVARSRSGVVLLCTSLLLTLTVCERTGPTAPEDTGPMELKVVSGDAQRAPIGTELPQPIVVQALNSKGKPLKSQLVNFVVVEGGGSVYAGSSITNNDGIAQEYWTLGPALGRNRLEVRAVDPTTGEKQNFATVSATGIPIPVATVTLSQTVASVEVGHDIHLDATLRDAAGNELTGREITWTSSNISVATVQNGDVHGDAVGGPVTITAASEGKSATARITVLRPQVKYIGVSPNQVDLPLGETLQLTAHLYDEFFNELSDRLVTWTSLNDAGGTVSSTGLVTGLHDGVVTIEVRSEGVLAYAYVHVKAPIATLTIVPTTVAIRHGELRYLPVEVRDAQNNLLEGRIGEWTSSDPSVVNFDFGNIGYPGIYVFGLAPGGPVTVSVTVDGVTASASVTVRPFVPDQYEPNNSGSSAFALGSVYDDGGELVITPNIFGQSDEDWFQVIATERSSQVCTPGTTQNFAMTVRLSNMPSGSDFDLEVRLGSPSGQMLYSNNGGDDEVTFPVQGYCGAADTFTFYVRVHPYHAELTDEPYRLGMQFRRN